MENKNLKKVKIIYWISTIIIATFCIIGFLFLNNQEAIEGVKKYGLPEWLRLEIVIGKGIGGILLLIPTFSKKLKEWVYVAIGIDYISAFIVHFVFNEYSHSFVVIIFLVILLTSYFSYHKLQSTK